ncbi:MAG: hypothetical protein ACI867_001746 [Glaciecola sp.]
MNHDLPARPQEATDPHEVFRLLIQLWATRSSEPHDTPAVVLMSFEGDERLVAFARRERSDESGTDPVTEAGALIAAGMGTERLTQATILLPVRIRDLHDDSIIMHTLVGTWIQRYAGRDWGMGACCTQWTPERGPIRQGERFESLPVDLSPVGSMLWDTQFTSWVGRLADAIQAVRIQGFDVVHSNEQRLRSGTSAAANRTRQRLRGVAQELMDRHAPMADHATGRSVRGAVPIDLPTGFMPACPL